MIGIRIGYILYQNNGCSARTHPDLAMATVSAI